MATRSAKIDQKADLIWAIADKLNNADYTVLSITQRGIIPKDFSNNEGQFANSYANYQLVHKGDFAMNHMDLLTGWVDISKYEGVTSPDYRVFVLNDKNGMCPKYYLYMILVVAEKYQTGFDEPLLHTMFVDKKLSGVKAVQTLSRLNRTTRGKVDTFVLDFVNSAEDIKASFEPFYEETVLLEETDPNVVYDMKNTLDDFRVYQKSEVDKFADIFYQNENQSAGDLGKLQGQLRPAIDRYEVLEVEKQDIFKSTLASFNRVYAYITQVCRLFDKDIHRFSIYSKFLYTMLPKGHGGEKINIDDKVLLEYYKLEKDFEGPIELESTEGGYTPISGDSGHREPKKDPLTVIIDKINEKYGTHFTEMDKVLVQMENDYANQEKWQSYAKNNDRATFMLLFEKDFPNMAADRYEQNDQFFRKLFDDPDMMRQVMETVGSVLYERLKKKYIFDPKSGVIEEATPETYVEDTYLTKK